MVTNSGKTQNPYVAGYWNVTAERPKEVWGVHKATEAEAQEVYETMRSHPDAGYTELVDPDGYLVITEGVTRFPQVIDS